MLRVVKLCKTFETVLFIFSSLH